MLHHSASVSRLTLPVLAAVAGVAVAFWQLPAGESPKAVGPRTGEDIYRRQCASCHGGAGQGTPDHYPHPLTGGRSLGQLTAYIEKSMPEDNPGACVGEDAKSVAAYIYDAFYSPAAQARNRPARIELSRLTVNQHVNVLADLVGSFRGRDPADAPPGLKARYTVRRRKKEKGQAEQAVDQIDARIDFNFGEKGPLDGQFEAEEYRVAWSGSLFAPETGDYEFNLATGGGGRLWLNGEKHPLIDAWVRSGNKSEHRETIRLLGGRRYPLRVEFSKSKSEKAFIALKWKPPHGAEQIVPSRCLFAGDAHEVFVLQSPLPADDRSAGYERGTAISKAWEQATVAAAIETADYVAARFRQLPGLAGESLAQAPKTREFCRQFVERAFRQPLSERERQVYVERRFQNAPDLETAVRRVVMLALVSPRFLYVPGDNDAASAANRLALILWDSLPDAPLAEAAAAGRLANAEQIGQQARRMLADPRAKAKLRLFFLQWLKVEVPPDLAKDSKAFAGFDAAVAADLRTSLTLFVDDVLWSPRSDFRQLLTSEETFMNDRLAAYYRADGPAPGDFRKVAFEARQRAGVLSHPYLMAAFAHTAASSPIHRGVFVARGMLGVRLRPPPIAVAPLAPDLQPTLTTRERVALQTQPAVCQTCHVTINPLGFALESFDAAGRLRETEQGRAVDAGGSYLARDGRLAKFRGARELALFLADSVEVHQAFSEQLFQYLVKQPVQAYGPNGLEELTRTFAAKQFNMQELAVEIAVRAASR